MSDIRLMEMHANICKSLANITRLQIVATLNNDELSVNAISRAINIPQSSISRHLGIMRKTGVVIARRSGQEVLYSLGGSEIVKAYEYMHKFTMRKISEDAQLIEHMNNS